MVILKLLSSIDWAEILLTRLLRMIMQDYLSDVILNSIWRTAQDGLFFSLPHDYYGYEMKGFAEAEVNMNKLTYKSIMFLKMFWSDNLFSVAFRTRLWPSCNLEIFFFKPFVTALPYIILWIASDDGVSSWEPLNSNVLYFKIEIKLWLILRLYIKYLK